MGLLTCLGIAAYALWYSSAGKFPTLPAGDNTYVDLGEAFLQGQLSLLETPDPQLVALDNPYDPAQRTAPYHWDASYYKGKYYLYWGPVPALAFAAVEGITHTRPPGALIVIIFFIGLSFIFLGILFWTWNRFFPSAPGFSLGLFILIGFINLPFLFLLGRPVIYETSIIAGQFFLLLGLLGWIIYIANPNKSGWVVMAGLCWGLAIASRYNLVISVVIYLAFILHQFLRDQNWKRIASLLVPFSLCMIALGLYNFARFGSPLETGFSYQLSIPEAKSEYYSISYLPSNFYIYLFFPMTMAGNFPFVISTLPFGKQFDEIVAGLFPSTPSTWLLALAPALLILARWRANPSQKISSDKSFRLLISMIMMAGLGQFLYLMIFFYDAMRYIADFYLPLTFMIAILVWRADDFMQHILPMRIALWLIVTVLAFRTAGVGFFGGFDIPPQIFRNLNPTLYVQLASYWNGFYAGITSLFH